MARADWTRDELGHSRQRHVFWIIVGNVIQTVTSSNGYDSQGRQISSAFSG